MFCQAARRLAVRAQDRWPGASLTSSAEYRAGFLIGEVMIAHRHRVSGRPPFGPGLSVVADLLFFLASTLTTGSPAAMCRLACALHR